MEKYILINSLLNYNGGFSSSESILRVTSYSTNENFTLVTGSTFPMQTTTAPKTININYQVFKSLQDFEDGEASIQPLGFPYSVNKAYNDEDIYTFLATELTAKNYENEIITN